MSPERARRLVANAQFAQSFMHNLAYWRDRFPLHGKDDWYFAVGEWLHAQRGRYVLALGGPYPWDKA